VTHLTLTQISATIRAINIAEGAGALTPGMAEARSILRSMRETAALYSADSACVAPAQKARKKKTATEEVGE
jgi:hypothetical protein